MRYQTYNQHLLYISVLLCSYTFACQDATLVSKSKSETPSDMGASISVQDVFIFDNTDMFCLRSEEICDAVDNDCDGQIDEDFQEQLNTDCNLGAGICLQTGTMLCVTENSSVFNGENLGEVQCHPNENSQMMSNGLDNDCDGLDNDCDGYTDEGFIRNAVECEESLCASRGILSCVDGSTYNSCDSLSETQQNTVDTSCDRIDDDCDGRVDEDYIPQKLPCGIGVCTRLVDVYCSNGELRELCNPIQPEVGVLDDECDGLDNDCDGLIDESFQDRIIECGLGLCKTRGSITCELGRQVENCIEISALTTEDDCDGLDNDCDGQVDENFQLQNIACGLGVCVQSGFRDCITQDNTTSTTEVCLPLNPPSSMDLCDGLDNNCNGQIDEDHIVQAVSCGVGECSNTGELICQNGNQVSTCMPGEPNPTERDASCNQLDDDCDGLIDEGYTVTVVDCPPGSCSEAGVMICRNGEEVDTCRETTVTNNIDNDCDGVDDDCDGQVDEDYVVSNVTCGQGVCLQYGTMRCISGNEQSDCTPAPASNNDQSCDGQDNDCDGLIDESFVVVPISCGEGACTNQGLRICQAGEVITQCMPLQPVGNDDNCNAQDDDCDGLSDEAYQPPATTCGIGACARTGTNQCVGGTLVDTCPIVSPSNHQDTSCNGVDDDCDGLSDEDYVSRTIQCGTGVCFNQTQSQCVLGAEVEACEVQAPTGNDDNCNQQDEDCDGQLDEGFVPVEVNCASCNEQGETVCTTQGIFDTCTNEISEDDTTCNSIDDDCDGNVDEDYNSQLEEPITCGLGACMQISTQLICVDGSIQPACMPLDPMSVDDNSCDGIDDDCDGNVDEDYQVTVSCGLGVCATSVTQSCLNGIPTPACVPPNPTVGEICGDQLDNDCDGEIEEGFSTLGEGCEVGIGVCLRVGTIICDYYDVRCSANEGNPEQSETCDGVDNDCDGQVDENSSGVGEACVDPTHLGLCVLGVQSCTNGILECVTNRPKDEVPCNGSDDDCDGEVDEQLIRSRMVQPGDPCEPDGCYYQCIVSNESLACAKLDRTLCR